MSGRRNRYGRLVLDPPSEPTPPAATPVATSSEPPKKMTQFEKNLLKFTGDTDEGAERLRERMHELASITIERASASSRRHYDNAKAAFEAMVKRASAPVLVEDYWEVEVVRKFGPQYIGIRVDLTQGRGGGRVKAVTVFGWYSHIVVVICKLTHDPKTGRKCGGALLYTDGLAQVIEDSAFAGKILKLAVVARANASPAIKHFGLVRHVTVRGRSFGLPEVQLAIEDMLKRSVSRGREARVQEIAMLIIGVATGIRACGLVPSELEYAQSGQVMKAGDVKVTNRGNTHWDVELRIMNHKGHNNTMLGRVIMYTITARKSIKNVLFDPWWITLDDLISAQENELRITSPDQPLFLSCKPGGTELVADVPMQARAFGGIVKDIVTNIHMPELTWYDLRRDLADDFSRKMGPRTAGLVLGHKDASSITTEKYSYGPGNLDVLGIRTGEAEDQFLPGTASRLELRIRSGSAISLVSKAIAALARDLPEEPEEEEEANQESEGNAALAALEKKTKAAVKKARKQVVKEDDRVHAANQEVHRRWDKWLEVMVLGSPLYLAVKHKTRKQNQICKITGHDLYAEALENQEMKEELEKHEAELREAFKAQVKVTQKVSRQAAEETRAQLHSDFRKSNIDTYHDKDKAVAYSKETSSLVLNAVEAASNSKATPSELPTSDDIIAAMNQEEDNEPVEQAVKDCREALNFSLGRMVEKRPRSDELSADNILADAVADAAPAPEDENELFRGGQPAEPWKDNNEPEPVSGITIADVRAFLIRLVAEPILFERECRANFEQNGGRYVCEKCHQLDPTAEPAVFTSETNLRKHRRNIHTEWNDLVLDMKHGDKFKCPGVCGTSKEFNDEEETRDHCLSDDCKDQKGFLEMKATHDAAVERNVAARKNQPAAQ
ncbi:hypothetical protein FRC07_006293, partial [Ceratobasidium sp. 392]